METVPKLLKELKSMGNPNTVKIYKKHGCTQECYGVKVADLKKIVKRIKKDYQLAKDLFDSGNSDAQYLAGLIADETKMKKSELKSWAKKADWYFISEFAVPWVAAEGPYGWELGLEWIDSKKEHIAACGWATLSSCLSYLPDEDLDKKAIKTLMGRIKKDIHNERNRVRYTMNNFVISTGGYVADCADAAKKTAKHIGKVHVEMGETACKVPLATDYIVKMEKRGVKKRKSTRC